MVDDLTIFIAGLGGVFLGMVLLYASIRITAVITSKLAIENEKI
jgi:hypothetical protein